MGASGPGVTQPGDFPIRHPSDQGLVNGRIVNSPHYAEMGGLDGPSKWPKGNEMRVEKPTGVRGATASSEKKAKK